MKMAVVMAKLIAEATMAPMYAAGKGSTVKLAESLKLPLPLADTA